MAFSIDNLLKRQPDSPTQCDSASIQQYPYNPWTNLGMGNSNQVGTPPLVSFGMSQVQRSPVVMPTLADLQLLFGAGGPKTYGRGNRRSGTERKPRQAYTNKQLETLEDEFQLEKYLTVNKRTELSKTLKLTENQIKTWFQNRRTKWKKQMTTTLRQIYRHPVMYPQSYQMAPIPIMATYQDFMYPNGGDHQTPSGRSSNSQSDQSQPPTSSDQSSSNESDDQRSD